MRTFTTVPEDDGPAVKGDYGLICNPAVSEVTAENILGRHRERTRR